MVTLIVLNKWQTEGKSEKDETRLTEYYEREIIISDRYKNYSNKLLQLLSEIEDMLDSFLGLLHTEKHETKLISNLVCQVYSILYSKGLIAKQMAATEITNLLEEETIEQTIAESYYNHCAPRKMSL